MSKSRNVPERLQFVNEGFSGDIPDSHNVMVEQLVIEPKEKTPDDMRVQLRRRVKRSSIYRRKVQETEAEANQLAGTLFLHICTNKSEWVKFVSSRTLPEVRAGAAPMNEETVSSTARARLQHRYAVVAQGPLFLLDSKQ